MSEGEMSEMVVEGEHVYEVTWVAMCLAVFLLISLALMMVLPYVFCPNLRELEGLSKEVSGDVSRFCSWCNKLWREGGYVVVNGSKEYVPCCCSGASCAGCCVLYYEAVLHKNISWEACYAECVESEELHNEILNCRYGSSVFITSLGVGALASVAITEAVMRTKRVRKIFRR